jgi:hypothetical protein
MHLKVKDVAAQLSVDEQTVAKWCRTKVIKAIDVRTPGASRACWRIPQEAFEDFKRLRQPRNQVGNQGNRKRAGTPTQTRFV